MKSSLLQKFHRWLFLPPVALGIVALYLFSIRGARDTTVERQEDVRTLRVIRVPQTTFVPRLLGYGQARPSKVWRAVAQVPGRVAQVHPQLRAGVLVRAGTPLVTIDKLEYELALQKLNAELRRAENELAEQDLLEENLTAIIKIEEQSLKIADEAVQRQRSLLAKNAVSKVEMEAALKELLQKRQRVQEQRHQLNLIPSQRRTLQATIDSHKAAIKDANLDLEKTSIQAPFDCRLRDVDIETGQYLAAGEALFIADGIASAEVVAQVSIEKAAAVVDQKQLNLGQMMAVLASQDATSIRELFSLDATIRSRAGELESSWKARFDNVTSNVDSKTRTLGFVAVVDRPWEKVIPGDRPPLVRGLFCEVEFRGRARSNRTVVPRLAIAGDYVYVVNGQSRLERRRVEVELVQGKVAVIRSGLQAGETLVVSDPTPAIDGQLVQPVEDAATLQELLTHAAGKTRLR